MELKDLIKKFQIPMPHDKRKQELFNAIRDSGKVTKIDDDNFSYKKTETQEVQHNKICWEILIGLDITLPEGFHASGAEEGFFAPTNKDNVEGASKKAYLTGEGERIKWPEFHCKPRQNDGCNQQQCHGPSHPKNLATTAEGPPNEHGGPSTYARERLPKDFVKH
mgnify:CR=1 FL=1